MFQVLTREGFQRGRQRRLRTPTVQIQNSYFFLLPILQKRASESQEQAACWKENLFCLLLTLRQTFLGPGFHSLTELVAKYLAWRKLKNKHRVLVQRTLLWKTIQPQGSTSPCKSGSSGLHGGPDLQRGRGWGGCEGGVEVKQPIYGNVPGFRPHLCLLNVSNQLTSCTWHLYCRTQAINMKAVPKRHQGYSEYLLS